MKKILAAVDFSNASSAVVAAAVEMAKAFGAELHLLHVIEPEPTYTAYGFTPTPFSPFPDQPFSVFSALGEKANSFI